MSPFAGLRIMDEADLPWVFEVERQCYPLPWSQEGLVKALCSGTGFVFCNQAGAPLGYCFVQAVADEISLLNFTVKPEYQGQGVGRQALQALLEHFQQQQRFQQLFLEVRVSNQAALRLYHSVGFNEIGMRRNYYRNADGSREDAIIMAYTFWPTS